MRTNIPSHLSDTELVAEVKRLARCERETTVSLISHLAELDDRRLYLGAGFPSLFMYCREVLQLSEHEAYHRIEAARTARRFPLVLDKLGTGCLNLTTVRLLAPHMTKDNHQELVASASGKSKREVEELLARHYPQPDVLPAVRKLPAKQIPTSPPTPAAVSAGIVAPKVELAPAISPPPARRPLVSPLGPERYSIKFTASAQTCEKLRCAQDLLRHAIPDGDVAEIFDRALTALLDDLAKKKFAATKRPRGSRGQSGTSRHIPAPVQRAVWRRDDGQCAFISKRGRRCTAKGFLEFHHVRPYGVGGEPTVENIELRCRAHNAFEAELFYGLRRPLGSEGIVRETGTRWRVGDESTRSGPSTARASVTCP